MMEDSLAEDRHSPVPGLVHRYPDRVLMLVTTQCASYCRYCTRSRIVGDPTQNFNRKDHEAQLEYLRRTPQVRDVLISGGDGLTLAPKLFESILRGLREIPHIEIIRIGSRVPVFLPQRIDDELCEMLEKYHPLWINLHFNHPNEITPEVSRAVDKLTKAGLPVGNQSVLLAGVNDCVHIQRALVHKLVANRIRPYYLYQCDLVEGSGHFRTPVGKGLEIIEGLRGHTSGYAVPTYVIDAPGGGGKIPVMPNYLICYSDHKVVLRNYEGYITTYEEPETYKKHDVVGVPVLPARAVGARPVGHPRPARGRADVDRAEGLRGGPHARQHRGASAPGPVQVGARSGSARSRARPARRCGCSRRATATAMTRPSRSPSTDRARSPARAKASRPRQPTGSCSSQSTWRPASSSTDPGSIPMMRRAFFYGWVVVAVTAIVVLDRPRASARRPGAFLLTMTQEPGWSTASVSFAAAAGLVVFGLAGPLSGWLMGRIGVRNVVLLSLAVTGRALMATSLVREIWQLTVLFGLVVRARHRARRERARPDRRDALVRQGPWPGDRHLRRQQQRRPAHFFPVLTGLRSRPAGASAPSCSASSRWSS